MMFVSFCVMSLSEYKITSFTNKIEFFLIIHFGIFSVLNFVYDKKCRRFTYFLQ